MRFNHYCMVLEIKKNHLEEYKNIHINPWKEVLGAIKKSGVKNLYIWIYKNFSILFFECEDINDFYKKYNEFNIVKKWHSLMKTWILKSQPIDGTEEIVPLEKIFDVNQQIKGDLKPY